MVWLEFREQKGLFYKLSLEPGLAGSYGLCKDFRFIYDHGKQLKGLQSLEL